MKSTGVSNNLIMGLFHWPLWGFHIRTQNISLRIIICLMYDECNPLSLSVLSVAEALWSVKVKLCNLISTIITSLCFFMCVTRCAVCCMCGLFCVLTNVWTLHLAIPIGNIVSLHVSVEHPQSVIWARCRSVSHFCLCVLSAVFLWQRSARLALWSN